jgi:hypothetical protein
MLDFIEGGFGDKKIQKIEGLKEMDSWSKIFRDLPNVATS